MTPHHSDYPAFRVLATTPKPLIVLGCLETGCPYQVCAERLEYVVTRLEAHYQLAHMPPRGVKE